MTADPRTINRTLDKIIGLAADLRQDEAARPERTDEGPNRRELLRMIDALSERGCGSCLDWVRIAYKDEQAKAAIAELAALKATGAGQPKPRKRPAMLPPNVVRFDGARS